MPKVRILEFSHYCLNCDIRQDTNPGPHIKRCPDYNGIMDTRIEGGAVFINRAPKIPRIHKKAIIEVEYKQGGPISTPAWLERESRREL